LNILAGEGLLERKYGSGSWSCRKRERLNIACMINDDFSLYHHKIYSRELFIVKNLLEILDEKQCSYHIFSIEELRRNNFSIRLLDKFDGLIVDTRFSDRHSRQLVNEFERPKLWPLASTIVNASGCQAVCDYIKPFSAIFRKARQSGIRRCVLHYANFEIGNAMNVALRCSSWLENESESIYHQTVTTQLYSYKYALNMPVAADILHVCDSDVMASGFVEAFLDRGLKFGEFHVCGNGNNEDIGFLPLGEPCLSTIALDIPAALRSGVELLCRRIRGEIQNDEIIRTSGRLLLRKSAFYEK
jgi:hypothetical protein